MYKFEKLEVWKMSRDLANKIYSVTDNFPKSELYVLASQMRRAAISVMSNIAEGAGSDSRAEFKLFLNYSIRSNYEVVAQLCIAFDRDYISKKEFSFLYKEAQVLVRRLVCFKKSITHKPSTINHQP